jgi:hypothetical protein
MARYQSAYPASKGISSIIAKPNTRTKERLAGSMVGWTRKTTASSSGNGSGRLLAQLYIYTLVPTINAKKRGGSVVTAMHVREED